MSNQQPVGVIRAECKSCGWTLERSLDAADLEPEQNQGIATRVVYSHSYKCQSDGEDGWGEQTDVDMQLDMTGEPS
ncbi:hypothetical protein [Natrarchaeobius oligotrophus]|uniref:Uncharacterized protein n=1 Tax=Natrarchaeobius chitinivorans TaxID=1679083 RepID=A0A3N6LXP8_NATCH|nr:hypothetical protein [Natrarchaeobius chitinivorans]RQG93767.1 hypothetical protein EA472_22745 [Natrarchaeobius chitinivorans]